MGADTEKRPLFSGQATPHSMNRIALPGLAAFAMALTSAPLSAQSGDAGVALGQWRSPNIARCYRRCYTAGILITSGRVHNRRRGKMIG